MDSSGKTAPGNSAWDQMLQWLQNEHGMNIDPTHGLLVECRSIDGAGRGLFARRACPPSTPLFTIPAKALINVKTLAALYPPKYVQNLAGFQQMSLHLLLHKPEGDVSADPAYGPYISTMPREFDSHPLTWLVNLETEPGRAEELLLSRLPPSVVLALHDVYRRFTADWDAVSKVLLENPALLVTSSRSDLMTGGIPPSNKLRIDYLWAWLNVNTRCIYYPIRASSSDKDNLTLSPILDFANHSGTHSQIMPVINKSRAREPGIRRDPGDFPFVSSPDDSVQQDQQLFLRYGGHANRTLFVEYGFVNDFPPDAITSGSFLGEIDVQDLVEDTIMRNSLGSQLRTYLEEEGYWGNWTLDSSPSPAHPSYRLITALRLYHLADAELAYASPALQETAIALWKDVLNGRRDAISPENEHQWRTSLSELCKRIERRAEEGLRKIRVLSEVAQWTKSNILLLWQEELEVARAILESVDAGVEF